MQRRSPSGVPFLELLQTKFWILPDSLSVLLARSVNRLQIPVQLDLRSVGDHPRVGARRDETARDHLPRRVGPASDLSGVKRAEGSSESRRIADFELEHLGVVNIAQNLKNLPVAGGATGGVDRVDLDLHPL